MKLIGFYWPVARLGIFLSVVGCLVGNYWVSELSVSTKDFRLGIRNGSSGVVVEVDESVQTSVGVLVTTYSLNEAPDFLDPVPRNWSYGTQSIVLVPHWLIILLLAAPGFRWKWLLSHCRKLLTPRPQRRVFQDGRDHSASGLSAEFGSEERDSVGR